MRRTQSEILGRKDDAACVALAAFLAWAPIPLGSNRPFFWFLNAAVVALGALFHLAGQSTHPERTMPLAAFRWPGLLFATGYAWMIVQVLPLPLQPFAVWSDAIDALGRDLPSRISVDPSATYAMLIRWTSYALFFLVVAQVATSQRRARRLVQWTFWVIAAHSAYAIVALLALGDPILFMPKWAYEGVATGTFVNRNSFATFAAFGVAIGATLVLDALGGRADTARSSLETVATRAAVYLSGLCIVTTALILSASRMGAAAGLCGALVSLLLAAPRMEARRAAVAIGIVAVGSFALGGMILSGGALLERLGSLQESADVRLELYEQVHRMISARPWTGFGGGTFADAFPLFHQLPLSADVGWDSAHNLYLELLADLGILGLAPIAAVVAILAYLIRSSWRHGPHPVTTAAIAASAVAAVHSAVDFSLKIEANVFVLLALLAAAYGQAWVRQSRHPMPGSSDPALAGIPLRPGNARFSGAARG